MPALLLQSRHPERVTHLLKGTSSPVLPMLGDNRNNEMMCVESIGVL